MDKWEACPRCGSAKTEYTSKGVAGCSLFFGGIVFASLGMWIPIIGWFIMIPMGLLAMVAAFIFPFFMTNPFRCKECKHAWKEGEGKSEV